MALRILIFLSFIFQFASMLSIDKADLNRQCSANWKRLQTHGIRMPDDVGKFEPSRVWIVLWKCYAFINWVWFFFWGTSLEVCDKTASICCNRYIETQIFIMTTQKYQSVMNKQVYSLRSSLINYAAQFGRKSCPHNRIPCALIFSVKFMFPNVHLK